MVHILIIFFFFFFFFCCRQQIRSQVLAKPLDLAWQPVRKLGSGGSCVATLGLTKRVRCICMATSAPSCLRGHWFATISGFRVSGRIAPRQAAVRTALTGVVGPERWAVLPMADPDGTMRFGNFFFIFVCVVCFVCLILCSKCAPDLVLICRPMVGTRKGQACRRCRRERGRAGDR